MASSTGQRPPRYRASWLAAVCWITASVGVAAATPVSAADSMMTWNGLGILKIYHLYAADDGRSHIEEIPVPSQKAAGATPGATALFQLDPQKVTIGTLPHGAMSDWHYAHDSRHLLVQLQGDLIFDIGDGRTYRIRPGEALLAEDWTGKGHRSGCDAANKTFCLGFDILVDPNPRLLPMRAAPNRDPRGGRGS